MDHFKLDFYALCSAIFSTKCVGLTLGQDFFICCICVIVLNLSLQESRDIGFICKSASVRPVVEDPCGGFKMWVSVKYRKNKFDYHPLLFVILYVFRTLYSKTSFKYPILLKKNYLKNVWAPEFQLTLHTGNNLSASTMPAYCIYWAPVWEGD